MKKSLLKICNFAAAFFICVSAGLTANAAYSAAEDFTVAILNVVDQNEREIEAVEQGTESIYIHTQLCNKKFDPVEVVLMAGIYDSKNGRMKLLNSSVKTTVGLQRTDVDLEFSKTMLKNASVAAGDRIRLYVWNGLEGMDQYISSIGSGSFSNYYKTYYTNSIVDYVPYSEFSDEANRLSSVKEDQWSYLRYNGDIGAAYTASQLRMATKYKTGEQSKRWYFANDKTASWYITEDGVVTTEANRCMIYNYTIGSQTAGKNLRISGKFTDDQKATLYIFKTNDGVISASDYGLGSITLSSDFYKTPLATVKSTTFELYIPASQANSGNDIMFWIHTTGTMSIGTDITIEVVEEIPEAYIKSVTMEKDEDVARGQTLAEELILEDELSPTEESNLAEKLNLKEEAAKIGGLSNDTEPEDESEEEAGTTPGETGEFYEESGIE